MTKKEITLSEVIAVVANAFKDKFSEGGQPYILHCLHVMNQMPQDDHELMIMAVAHDLIEDTDYTLANLSHDLGFTDRCVQGIAALTHEAGVPYRDYIRMIALNPDARLVKMADIQHSSDNVRMKGLRAMAYLKV